MCFRQSGALADQKPRSIDSSTAVSISVASGILNPWLFRRQSQVAFVALLKKLSNAAIATVSPTEERNKDKCQRSGKLVGSDVRDGEACMFRDALRFCGGGGGGGGVCFIICAIVFAGQDESSEGDAHCAMVTHVCLARSFPFCCFSSLEKFAAPYH